MRTIEGSQTSNPTEVTLSDEESSLAPIAELMGQLLRVPKEEAGQVHQAHQA